MPVKRDPINFQDKFEKRVARYRDAIEMMTEQVAAAGTWRVAGWREAGDWVAGRSIEMRVAEWQLVVSR